MLSAEALHEEALSASRHGRHARARALLGQARRQLEPGDLLARVEASLAYVWSETGEREAALGLLGRALTYPGLTRQTEGLLHSQKALLLMLDGFGAAALPSFDAAIERLREPTPLAKAHLNRGGVYLQQGRLGPAIADFRQSERYYLQAGDTLGAAKASHNVGYAFLLAGELSEALAGMRAAYPAFSDASPALKAMAEQDLAEVLMAAGLVTQGRRALTEASAIFARHRLHQRRGEAELALARSLTYANSALALVHARRAAAAFARIGAVAWRVRAESAVLAAEVELGRVRPTLLDTGASLADELQSQGLHWGAASVRLHTARVHLRRGDQRTARLVSRRVRVTDEAPLSLRLLARDVRAELAVTEGRRTQALAQVRCGLKELHAWQSSFGSLDLQTMVVGHGIRLAKRGLALAVESDRASTLFEWSERARMLASRVQPVRAPADEQIAADLAELRRLATPEDGVRVPQARRAEELRARVRERAWQLRGSGEVAEPVTLRELRARLDPDTALVAWVVTDDEVAGLVVTGRRATRHRLGGRADLDRLLDGLGADLDVAGAELPAALASVVRRQLAARLAALSARLVTPLAGRIGDRSVVLTPSGALAAVPWTLLPGLVGRPVTVAQSATSWLARKDSPPLLTAGFVAGPRVVRAEAEVLDAARHWPDATVLTGESATASRVAALAERADVLHVAAHGRHSADNPLFSGLELAGGPWYGYDIDQLERVPAVVLLSACEVGRSSVRAGEELIGMTTAWLHAGAGCVIASAAAVNDAVAHQILTRVHAGLAGGADPSGALAEAVPGAGDDGPPAPFVCFR